MTVDRDAPAPVWTLATANRDLPVLFDEEGITPARLSELRTALATLADAPIATLEAHPLPTELKRAGGISLHAASPLATHLSQLVAQTVKSGSAPAAVAESGETLYRMVVPAKVAAQVGKGLVTPLSSKAVPGGIHSALRDASRITANASFVPVTGTTAVAGTSAAAGAAAGAGAITVAAPLIVMAVAVGVSAYAEHQRQESIDHLTDLLEKLHVDKLDDERSELDGCRGAIDKATSILLDRGSLGLTLGLDSAVHAIGTAVERADRRVKKWQSTLSTFPDGPVEIARLKDAFPGIGEAGGPFYAHLELARLAIALTRRVLVLQAVEHAQHADEEQLFPAFVRSLQADERRIDDLEAAVSAVLLRLSSLEIKRDTGLRNIVITHKDVDDLLRTAYQLRALGDDVAINTRSTDVAINIARYGDGSLTVYPALSA